MKVGDIVEFICPAVFMEEKFKSRGVGIIVAVHVREYDFSNPAAANAFEVQWVNDEVSWEHKTYLELL
tara:strand:- start:558 stop:761 length:204 start_codon:yes stop_codon:yes gene_type:complete